MTRLPAWVNPPALPSTQNRGHTPRATLNRTATREQRFAVAGLGATIPDAYGRIQVAAKVVTAVAYNNKLMLLCVWGQGEWDQIQEIYSGDTLITDVTHYLGTDSQTADADMVAAISGYADDLPGVVYSIVKLSASEIGQNIYAVCRARKTYDPRTTSTIYSANPSLAVADYITRVMGRAIDWASVTTCADANDELLGDSTKRRKIGLLMDRQNRQDEWLDTLREYAGVYIVWDDPVQLVAAAPRPVADHTFTDSDIKSINISKRRSDQAPNRVTVYYTEKSDTKWRQVAASTDPIPGEAIRESVIRMPGVTSYAHAWRIATERCNAFRLVDLDVELDLYDEGLTVTPGDRIDVTHAYGLTAKPLRVLQAEATSPGRWHVITTEYDPAIYDDSTPAGPTYPDTQLPDPTVIPDGPAPVLAEEVFQQQNGNWSTRLRITWSAITSYPYNYEYRVRVTDGANLVWSGKTNDLEFVTGTLQEGVQYIISVDLIGMSGLIGNAGSDSITAQGKQLPPGDVPFITAIEVGGEVRGQIGPAIDVDIWRYEWRYGALAGSWEVATVVDRLDSLRLFTREIPPGDWLLCAKAIDSVGNFSANAISTQISVTLDAGAFLQGESSLGYDAAESSNIADAGNGYVTAIAGDTWDSLFPNLMDSYTNPLLTYHSSGTSEWVSDALDLTAIANGTWQAQVWAQALSGSYSVELEISDDAISWTPYSQLSVNAQGRYGRVRITATGTSTLFVSEPYAHIRCDVIPKEEEGEVAVGAGGVATVTLSGTYSKFVSLILQTTGTAVRKANYDNLQTGNPTSFDVHHWDVNDNYVAGTVGYRAKVI